MQASSRELFNNSSDGVFACAPSCRKSSLVQRAANRQKITEECPQRGAAVLTGMRWQVADRFGMEWKLFYDNNVKRVAILVSRMDHCLYDILIRHRAGAAPALQVLLQPCVGAKCLPNGSAGQGPM